MLSPDALRNEKDCLTALKQINAKLSARVPEHNFPGLAQWLVHGVQPGSFLTALLSNDLRGVMQQGDDENLANLQELWQFLYMQIPAGAWGSLANMREWAKEREKANSTVELDRLDEEKRLWDRVEFARNVAAADKPNTPYPWCSQPHICKDLGSCPRDPNCGE